MFFLSRACLGKIIAQICVSKRWRKNGRVFLTEQVGGEAAVVESIAALGGDVEARRCNEFKTDLPFLLFVSPNFVTRVPSLSSQMLGL